MESLGHKAALFFVFTIFFKIEKKRKKNYDLDLFDNAIICIFQKRKPRLISCEHIQDQTETMPELIHCEFKAPSTCGLTFHFNKAILTLSYLTFKVVKREI